MVQTVKATDLTRYDVERKFGLQLVQDESFFCEWLDNLPELTNAEKQALDLLKARYLHLSARPMLESIVKMVVLSPLLALAGFYDPPFYITAEEEILVKEEVDGEIIRGKIDILVVQGSFWIGVVQAKREQADVMTSLPQTLSYMMANPKPSQPAFGLLINGREVVFVKLTQQNTPKYALSNTFSLFNRGNDFYQVLQILKKYVQTLFSV